MRALLFEYRQALSDDMSEGHTILSMVLVSRRGCRSVFSAFGD